MILTDVKVKFLNKVLIGDNCWEFIGGRKSSFGHGSFYGIAHRWAWKLFKGPIPRGMQVLHSCDNPPCVRPSHLFLGTQGDNIRDRDRKGRQVKGSRCAKAKMHEELVIRIRKDYADGVSIHRLANQAGVTVTAVRYALQRKTWKHI